MARKADGTPNAGMFKDGMEVRRTHGMKSFNRRGVTALTPYQQGRYEELRDQFKSEPGRLEYRRELAVHLAMVLEMGFFNLREIAERGESIWTSSPIARMGVYVNSLQRLLDGWPSDKPGETILDVIASLSPDDDTDPPEGVDNDDRED